MSYNRLRTVSKFSLLVGVAFLMIGVALFIGSDAGEKPEKIGIVFMMYGGVMLGVGFTALVALKTPN
jgi:hypothetical protein